MGIPPGTVHMEDGPLVVSALRVDPPERSVHFHLSLGEVTESGVVQAPSHPSPEELRALTSLLPKLNTPKFTVVPGPGLDHGWVWEQGSIDLGCTPFSQAVNQPIAEVLPEGDGEREIRRFIDDSIDLLSGQELNRIRVGEGQPRLNLVWPWGPGFRARVPSLALRRGIIVAYRSDSLRLAGLVRLAGYQFSGPLPGKVLDPDWAAWRHPSRGHEIAVVPGPGLARAENRPDHAQWMIEKFDREFLPRFDVPRDRAELRLVLIAPDGGVAPENAAESSRPGGLAVFFDPRHRLSSTIPWDERAFDEPRVPRQHLWETVDSALSDVWPWLSASA